jgi:hypothetical protein
MKLDRKALEKLACLNDTQLRAVIEKLASEYHLDLSALRVSANDLQSLRRAMQTATDEELMQLTKQLRQGGKR